MLAGAVVTDRVGTDELFPDRDLDGVTHDRDLHLASTVFHTDVVVLRSVVDKGPSAATPRTTDSSSRPPSALTYPSMRWKSVIGALIPTPKIDDIADARPAAANRRRGARS